MYNGDMPPKSTGSRFNLAEPLAGDLADFCSAHYGVSETNIIREALRQFIDARLAAEPEMRKRFDAARKDRLGAKTNLRVLKPETD